MSTKNSLISASATVIVALAFFLFGSCSLLNTDLEIDQARCEYLVEPICIDTQSPRFSWTYSGRGNFEQAYFKFDLATSVEELDSSPLWTSGEVKSDRPFVKMESEDLLESCKDYYWRVTAWNADSLKVLKSEPQHFQTAFMQRKDWTATWVTDSKDKDFEAAPMFRKAFNVASGVKSAQVYMSACAYALVSIDGQQISDAFLDPGYTHYDKRNLYTVTDVTKLLSEGDNVITAVLGNGFYNEIKPVATWNFENARWRDRARFILELRITHKDGSETIVGTDSTWRVTSDGPYLRNNIYAGDTYDAGREIEGVNDPAFDASSWESAVSVEDPSPLLVAQKMPQIKPSETLEAVNLKKINDTTFVFDFGKNISGLCRLNVKGKAGDVVSMAYAELVKDDGSLEPGNINIYYHPLPGYPFQTDTYILKGNGKEEWTPAFSYHGFRYVEVKCPRTMKLDLSSLTALHFHTDVESVGSFECSNDELNTLWDMTRRTYLNNLMSIPTDCPQREKNGWTADAHLSQEIGILNFDALLFYEKWFDDFVDNQRDNGQISGIIPTSDWGYDDWIGPVWDAAMFIMPYNLYLYYGDKSAIEKMWPVCEKYLGYLKNREDESGLVYYGIGDWLPYDTKTPTEYTTALFYYYDYKLMTEFAKILGKDSVPFQVKAEILRDAVNSKFYNKSTGIYSTGSQAGQAIALYTGVVPDEDVQTVSDALADIVDKRDGFLDFGSMGSKVVLRMLTKYGHADKAIEMALKEEYPSWIAWIRDGYTSLGETWVMSPKFNDASLDHIFFGDVSAWLVNDIVGIQKDDSAPGFGHFIIAPNFVEGLDWARASYDSVRGEISVEWRKEDDIVVLETEIPKNTSALLKACGKSVELESGSHVLRFNLLDTE